MTSFYTRTGDDGTTGLLGKGRFSKADARLEALGSVDEASAALGMARAFCLSDQTASILVAVQRDLYRLMSELAALPENATRFQSIDSGRVTWLEAQTDAISALTEVPQEFIVPGETPAGAAMALARTIIRRAERRVVALKENGDILNPDLIRYLNRLSSLCFVLELFENQVAGKKTQAANQKDTV
jgi:cob(I)alamin adenosyltransferase